MSRPIARALAASFAIFLMASVVIEWTRGVEAAAWALDMGRFGLAGGVVQLLLGATLLAYAAKPSMSTARRVTTVTMIALAAACALLDGVRYEWLLASGRLASGTPLAFSFLVFLTLFVVMLGAWRVPTRPGRFGRLRFALVLAVAAAGFPLTQMFTFGLTDYRRPADAVVVFGARVYADGRPSDALHDRVRTACELYRSGLVSRLILSGGPGDGPVSEPEAMRVMAVGLGVPASACILDGGGLNTRATLDNARSIAQREGFQRVLAVSHFYHLPRIKLLSQRLGLAVYTVPAPQGDPLVQLPRFIAREAAACWAYYLRS